MEALQLRASLPHGGAAPKHTGTRGPYEADVASGRFAGLAPAEHGFECLPRPRAQTGNALRGLRAAEIGRRDLRATLRVRRPSDVRVIGRGLIEPEACRRRMHLHLLVLAAYHACESDGVGLSRTDGRCSWL